MCWGSGRGTPKSGREKAPGDNSHGPEFRRKSRSSSDDRVGRGDNTRGCEGHGLPDALHIVKATCEEHRLGELGAEKEARTRTRGSGVKLKVFTKRV